MKNDSALSTSECFRLCAEMRISLMALIVSRNCVGVSLEYVSGAATRIEDEELSCLRNVYTIANVKPGMSRVQ